MPSRPKPVVELKFEPGEYLCHWHVPSKDGTTLTLPGSIEVDSDSGPKGIIHGDVPLEALREGVYSFPQSSRYKALKLSLANGGTGVVLNARVDWGTGIGFVSGGIATLALGNGVAPWNEQTVEAAGEDEEFLYGSCEVQIGALDALMGVTPIGWKNDPREAFKDDKYTWTSVTNPDASLEWSDDHGNTVKAWYPSKINSHDFYNVSIRYAPVLKVTVAEPASLPDFIDQWLAPIRGIASIATGRSQPVHMIKLRPSGDDGSPWGAAQVFGTALTQAPFDSSADQVRSDKTVLQCAADGVSLLDLIRSWWRLRDEQHPLIETYAGMLHVKDAHPRSRFLLLIQSLEAMHGHDCREEFEERRVAYVEKRDELLDAVGEHISGKQRRFLKDAIDKEPKRNLSTALEAAFDLPEQFAQAREALEGSRLVSQLLAEDHNLKPLDALRVVRNGLAHGTRGFDAYDLDQVNDILDRLVRAHGLRLLGCPQSVFARLAVPADR